MTSPYHGSCLCGSVRFEIDEFLPAIGHCHCSMCRKFHGAAYATIAGVAAESFRWTSGEEALRRYTAENGTARSFCGNCGSSLTFFSPNAPSDVVEIALGSLDDEIPVRPDAHIYVSSGADWHEITDDLPQFEAGRNSMRLK